MYISQFNHLSYRCYFVNKYLYNTVYVYIYDNMVIGQRFRYCVFISVELLFSYPKIYRKAFPNLHDIKTFESLINEIKGYIMRKM